MFFVPQRFHHECIKKQKINYYTGVISSKIYEIISFGTNKQRVKIIEAYYESCKNTILFREDGELMANM